VDYEHSSSCGRAFPSLNDFLSHDSHPPCSLQPSNISFYEGRDCSQAHVKDGRYEEGGSLVNNPSKSLP
jgi:hypothetical protein